MPITILKPTYESYLNEAVVGADLESGLSEYFSWLENWLTVERGTNGSTVGKMD